MEKPQIYQNSKQLPNELKLKIRNKTEYLNNNITTNLKNRKKNGPAGIRIQDLRHVKATS